MQEQTLGTQSMIVSLELGLPRQATQLKEESKKIETENHAEEGTVRTSIHYFRKKDPQNKKKEIDGLTKLKEFQYEYKCAVNNLARYPYSGGFYLAPAGVVEDLLKAQEKFTAKQLDVWMDWADNVYPTWLDDAPTRMGALFNESDFPNLGDCKKRFRCSLTLLPLAEKDQVARITLISPKSQQLLMAHADETSKAAIAELHKSIWKDFMAPLQQVVTVFEKDKPKIYETLLGNLMQIVSVIPSYKDLTGDSDLVSAAEKVKEVFGTMSTEDLRTSKEARDLAFSSAKEMVAQFTPFARKFV
jgi:hypothetical protein